MSKVLRIFMILSIMFFIVKCDNSTDSISKESVVSVTQSADTPVENPDSDDGTTVTEDTPTTVSDNTDVTIPDTTIIEEPVIEDPIIEDPIIPEEPLVVIIPSTIKSDVEFYYVTDTKEFYYFKERTLTPLTFTYKVNSIEYSYIPTKFFSIVESGVKTIYFSMTVEIDSISYTKYFSQTNNIITEISSLPAKPVKSRITYSGANDKIEINGTNSELSRKNSTGTWISATIKEINFCVVSETNYGTALIFNVSRPGTTEFKVCGLYYAPTTYRSTNLHYSEILLDKKGEVW
jgi:hypothetical protein